MTDQELFERQRHYWRLTERSKTIIADLKANGSPLTAEAAEIIEFLQGQVTRARNDLNEEIREGQRAARDTYAEGQWNEREEQ